MTALSIILNIVLILISIVLIAVVLMQQGQRQGLGAIAGGAETFFGKGKSKGLDAKLAKITKIAAVAFIVLAIACTIVVSHIDNGDETVDLDALVSELSEDDQAALESGEAHLHDDGTVHYEDEHAEGEAADEAAADEPAEAEVAETEAVEAEVEVAGDEAAAEADAAAEDAEAK